MSTGINLLGSGIGVAGVGIGGSSGAGGTTAWFTDTAARDAYYAANPSKLKPGISVGVGSPVVAYTYDGTEWKTGALAFKGDTGKSAYQFWLDNGNTGTIADFLASLRGAKGKSVYELWLDAGNTGTFQQFLDTLVGSNGLSAYEIWIAAGNTGTIADFLASLKGNPGNPGSPGAPGAKGDPGNSFINNLKAAGESYGVGETLFYAGVAFRCNTATVVPASDILTWIATNFDAISGTSAGVHNTVSTEPVPATLNKGDFYTQIAEPQKHENMDTTGGGYWEANEADDVGFLFEEVHPDLRNEGYTIFDMLKLIFSNHPLIADDTTPITLRTYTTPDDGNTFVQTKSLDVFYTWDAAINTAITDFLNKQFHIAEDEWLGIFKAGATITNYLSIYYNWNGTDPAGQFRHIGMTNGLVYASDIGSWIGAEFKYVLDKDKRVREIYVGDENNLPQLITTQYVQDIQPAYTDKPLQELMDETSGFNANSAYFIADTNTVITFPATLGVFTFSDISGSSRFISNGETVEVWFKSGLIATLNPGDSYTFIGHCAFMGLTGYTGDLSGVLWTSPEIVYDAAILAAEIDNLNADLRAQMEINRGLLAKKAEIIKFGEQSVSSIEGVFTAPEVDAAIVEADPHDFGIVSDLPTPVPQDNAYQCGWPDNDSPALYKPEQVGTGYESASPVTAYISTTFDYTRATAIDRVKFADFVNLVELFEKYSGRFMYRGAIYLFPVADGEQYERYIKMDFLTNCGIVITEYSTGGELVLTNAVYTGDAQTEVLSRVTDGLAVSGNLADYDPATGYLTFTESMYWAISPDYMDNSYEWMQRHQAGGGYAEKNGSPWQWIFQSVPYAPLGSVIGENRSGYLSWLKYKDIITGYLRKITTSSAFSQVYLKLQNGVQTNVNTTNQNIGGAIVNRDGNGNFSISDPIENSHAATKKYVDDADNLKLDKSITNAAGDTTARDGAGFNRTFPDGSIERVFSETDGGGHEFIDATNGATYFVGFDKGNGLEIYIKTTATGQGIRLRTRNNGGVRKFYYLRDGLSREPVTTDEVALIADINTVLAGANDYTDQQISEAINQLGTYIGQSFDTAAALSAYSIPSNVDEGDFTFVQADENYEGATTRYICHNDGTNKTFDYAYTLNQNFSVSQMAAINSGITADKVAAYDAYATGKQGALSTDQLAAVNSGITAGKVDLLTFIGTQTVSTLANIPVTKSVVCANVGSAQTLSVSGNVPPGCCVHVLVKNTAAAQVVVAIPNSGTYSPSNDTSLTIAASDRAELNIIRDYNENLTKILVL